MSLRDGSLVKVSLVPRPPPPTGERWSGTVASNSWSKHFRLKKDVHCNERPFRVEKTFDAWTKNLKQLSVPDCLSPVGHGDLGMRLGNSCIKNILSGQAVLSR